MKKSLFKTTALCAALMVGLSAFADPVDGVTGFNNANPAAYGGLDAGSIDSSNFIRNQRYVEKQRLEATKDPAVIEAEVAQKMALLNTEQVAFTLKSIKITGNTVFPEYVLQRLVDFKLGQKVTINDLIMSANDITDYYQSKGYISTVAYLPPQKVQNGAIEIKVLEGKYGNVEINPGRWERASYLNKKYLEDKGIQPGKILNVKDVRAALQEMSTEEYMQGSVSFADNEESEEYSDVTLDVKDRFPINLDLRYDNQGREAIGTHRGVIYAGLHDVTGHGDTLMGTVSYSSRSIGAGGIYSIPIAKNDTRLNLGYSYSHVNIGKLLKQLDISGDSHNVFVGVSRRLAQGSDYRLYGDITLDLRNTDLSSDIPLVNSMLTDYRTRVIRGSLTNVRDDYYGRWLFNGGIAGGIPIDASDHHKARNMSSNNFVKVNASAARLQVLPFNHMLIWQVNGQYANRHLWASEAMQVGGIASVRGYEEGFRIGDYGVTTSVEYRMPIPGFKALLPKKYEFISDSIQLAGFYDFGWFGDRFISGSSDYLMSAGPGIVVKLTKYISANLYWGFPIGKTHLDYAGHKYRDDCRFHFTITSNIL
ncbi:MAG: ShlB/FhaC/HecB family hemolysin secretion/activation protein [Candidatus Gastranaerophilales bacterium]|nr:ShlB/FhaC/HecB family hemolysin secretion/activation protein [Candidatus Gastranaerophilales bacterium]